MRERNPSLIAFFSAACNDSALNDPTASHFPPLSLNLWCSRSPFTHVPLFIKISKDFATIFGPRLILSYGQFAGLTHRLTRADGRRNTHCVLRLRRGHSWSQCGGSDHFSCHRHSLHSSKLQRDPLFLFALKMLFGGLDAKRERPSRARPGRLSARCPSIAGRERMAVILLHRQRCLHGGRASPNRRGPAGRAVAHLYSAAFFPMPSCGSSVVRERPFLFVSWGSFLASLAG